MGGKVLIVDGDARGRARAADELERRGHQTTCAGDARAFARQLEQADGWDVVVGRAGSEPMPPEEVGRMGQIRKVAEATRRAMADAGLSDASNVHLVMVKVPGLTVASIRDAEKRGPSDRSEARISASQRTGSPRSSRS